MSALGKKVGLVVILLDLFVGVAAASVLHPHSAPARAGGKMSAGRLEQIVEQSVGARASCSSDPTGGWDYYCISSDGSRTLYDVSADAITQDSSLPSYR